MIQRKGDVFTTEAAFIGHGVNLRGVMGRGIAATIRAEFPEAYEEYREACEDKSLKLGEAIVSHEDQFNIVHMATQVHLGPDARYDAIFKAGMYAALDVMDMCHGEDRQPILAIPRIGCGIGGLEWEKVETLLKAVEILNPGFQFEVWNL